MTDNAPEIREFVPGTPAGPDGIVIVFLKFTTSPTYMKLFILERKLGE